MKKIIKKFALAITSLAYVQALPLSAADPVLSAPSVTVQENLEQLIKTRSCRGCDLAGLDFNRMDLSGVDLEGADLSSGKFYLTNLAGANLKNTKLTGAIFGGADLGEADLRGADLDGTSLDSAYLGETLLDGDSIEVVSEDMTSAMIDSSPEKTSISEPPPAKSEPPVAAKKVDSMENSDVVAKDSEKNKVEKAGASDKKPTGDDQPGAEVAEIQPETTPEVVDLIVMEESQDGGNTPISAGDSSEDLILANIKKANLARLLDKKRCFGCDLSGLNISNKNLKGADLEKADLSGCNLEGTRLDGANLKDALLQRANLRDASLKKADLYKADLTDADLTNAKVKGAMLDGAKISEAIGLVPYS